MNIYKLSQTDCKDDVRIEVYSTWEKAKQRFMEILEKEYPDVFSIWQKGEGHNDCFSIWQKEQDHNGCFTHCKTSVYFTHADSSLKMNYQKNGTVVLLKIERVDLYSGTACEF